VISTRVSVKPTPASRSADPLAPGASARTVHLPGEAKNRNAPLALDTTSAVNSPVASSSRTYAAATG